MNILATALHAYGSRYHMSLRMDKYRRQVTTFTKWEMINFHIILLFVNKIELFVWKRL